MHRSVFGASLLAPLLLIRVQQSPVPAQVDPQKQGEPAPAKPDPQTPEKPADATPAKPPPPGPWGLVAKGKYLAALALAESEHENKPSDPMKCDALGIMRSFVGDAQGALEVFESMPGATAPPIDVAEIDALGKCEPRDAIAEIVAATRKGQGRQVVILNEAHHVPMHRAFSLELARALRKEGFEWFAAETFTKDTDSLQKRGFPTQSTGFYSAEPNFGELIREVLALGYRPVAYETETFAQGGDASDGINHRETEQCRHLIERIFKDHPDARVLIHVGYSHATEDWRKLGDGREQAWMAARLGRELGIDPLTIDQTEQMPASTPEHASAAWRLACSKGWLTTPRVMRKPDGSWFVGGAQWKGRVDLQVFHPPVTLVDGRPDWMTREGHRKPVEIPPELEPKDGRVLVQAFLASESDDAVPVDQVVLLAGEPTPVLLLPESQSGGGFRLVVQDEKGNEVARQPLER